jgi:hypothetical protein
VGSQHLTPAANKSRFKIADQLDRSLKCVALGVNQVRDGGWLSGFNVKSPAPSLDEALFHQGFEPAREFQLVHDVIIALMTAAARSRLALSMKRRWAKAKKAGKKRLGRSLTGE